MTYPLTRMKSYKQQLTIPRDQTPDWLSNSKQSVLEMGKCTKKEEKAINLGWELKYGVLPPLLLYLLAFYFIKPAGYRRSCYLV